MRTKEKILSKSIELFNTDGIEKITTRHIATAIGISQGNLHYHYSTKDVIIEVLFKQFIQELKEAEHFKGLEFGRELVIASMKTNFAIMYKYRFFFKDNEVVWRRLPTIKSQLLKLFDRKRSEVLQLIALYKSQRIFREEISSDQIDFLSEQFIFSITSWLSASEYLDVNGDTADYFARFTFRHWLPYLKVEEMKAWEEILS